MGMLKGLNHITIAVQDVDRSLGFYCDLLGGDLHVKWDQGAYVTIGECWICLSLDPASTPGEGYGHIAFSIAEEDYILFRQLLDEHAVEIWQHNTSEGDSLYFLDPDGHKLEAHVGTLESRLNAIADQPYKGQRIF